MGLFAFPCPACGEQCQFPDRFCPGCGTSVRSLNPGGLPTPSPVVPFGVLAVRRRRGRVLARRLALGVPAAAVAFVVVYALA